MSSHREPPKPPHYHNPLPGQCRWCGQLIFKADGQTLNKRANWHPACVKEYKLVAWPAVTRRAVFKRDKGVCIKCGHQCAKAGKDVWHLDHIKPLIEAAGDIKYWTLANLQTLCQPCHHAKTGSEATARAEARRAAKNIDDDKPTT